MKSSSVVRHFAFIILTAILAVVPASGAPVFKSSSLLSRSKWVKVKVPASGIYRLSHERLAEWGFTSPERVTVAGYGSVERAHTLDSAPDDLPVIPVLREDDAIYFYGEGDTRVTLTGSTGFTEHRNFYSTSSYYFIGESATDPSPDMTVSDVEPDPASEPTTLHDVVQIVRLEEEVMNGSGAFFFSRNFAKGSVEMDFDIRGIASDANLSFYYIGSHSQTDALPVGVEVSGGLTLKSSNFSNLKNSNLSNWLYRRSDEQKAVLSRGTGPFSRLTLRFTDSKGLFGHVAMDYAALRFKRENIFTGPAMTMDFFGLSQGRAVAIDGFDGGGRIIDVSTPSAPVCLKAVVSADTPSRHLFAGLPAYSHSRVAAFIPSAAVPEPEVDRVIASPETDLHGMEGVDMLIVTTDGGYAPSLRLAAAHEETQGMKVAVVRLSEVFDQFSSGALHPNGLRHFARMLHSRADRPLRYLLIVGDTYFDTRRVRLSDKDLELTPVYLTEDYNEAHMDSKDYCADSYFGFFVDRVNPSLAKSYRTPLSLAVGRIPFAGDDLDKVIDKTVACLRDPSLMGDYTNAVIWGGLSDANQHVDAAEMMARLAENRVSGMKVTKPHHALFPKTGNNSTKSAAHTARLETLFAGRPSFISFSGHGSYDAIDSYDIETRLVRTARFGSHPVAWFASCATTQFDTSIPTLSKEYLRLASGPVALIGASRSVYLSYNGNLANEFVARLYEAEPGDCIGDIFRKAMTAQNLKSEHQCVNNLCYNLLGDPALPVPVRTGGVSIEQVGGKPLVGQTEIAALEPVVLKGVVTDADGNVDTSFSGSMLISFFGAPRQVKTLAAYDSANIYTSTLDEDILFSTSVEVEEGRWEAVVTPPVVSVSGPVRVCLEASSVTEGRRVATGGSTLLSLVTSDEVNVPDNEAPVITILLNGSDSPSAVRSGSMTLDVAVTDGGSGMSVATGRVGGAPKVYLDGVVLDNVSTAFRSVSGSEVSLSSLLQAPAPGMHTITVRASDVAGNPAVAGVDFNVVSAGSVSLALAVDTPVLRESALFEVDGGDAAASSMRGRLVVEGIDGSTVTVIKGVSFPYEWDGKDAAGTLLPDGNYRVSALLENGQDYASTPGINLAIVRK